MDVVRDRLHGAWDRTRSGHSFPVLEKVQSAAESMIEERPALTGLMTFGLGFGLGIAVGAMLSEYFEEDKPTYESMYDTVTKNVSDTLSRMVPDAVARHFRN